MNDTFFTRPSPRFNVPHDRIGVRLVLVVHMAITRAFELIRAEGKPLATALENDITIKLEDVLNNDILGRGEIPGFDRKIFSSVRRVEVVNYDGTKKGKKPDLCFDLQREHRVDWNQIQDALFAECKPIDKKHPLSGHYCAVEKDCTGIERFVIGDYAWAMEEALMIGYARKGFSIDPHLIDALKDPLKKTKLGNPTSPRSISERTKPTLYWTRHLRTFPWVQGSPATPIVLYHSWHNCD